MNQPGFGTFVAIDETDAPQLFQRMSNSELRVDGQRYGIRSRLIARPGVRVEDLAKATLDKLCRASAVLLDQVGGVVLSSRIVQVQEAAERLAHSLGFPGRAVGVEQACSGFPAAVATAIPLCEELQRPIAVVTAEIISSSVNWEPGTGQLSDHQRACGQAAPLFADGAAGVLVLPAGWNPAQVILDCWADEVPDEKQLIQKVEVEDSLDPWGRPRPGKTDCMAMPGRRGLLLVRRAPRLLFDALERSLRTAQASGLLDGDNVSHVVPHQANGLIIAQLEKLAIQAWTPPPKVWDCIQDAGNTVSASIPTAMARVHGPLPEGAVIGMPSVGAGGPGYRPHVLSVGCVLTRTRSVP